MNRLLLTALVSTGLVASVPAAWAETEGDVPQIVAQAQGHGPQAHQFAHGQPRGQAAFRSPVDRVEAQLAYLKTALKITGAQEAQWNAYAEVRRKHAREAAERMEKFRGQMAERQKGEGPRARPSAVERLERRQQMMAFASTRLSETLAAVKPLYAALSDEQKQIADELLAPRGPRGGQRGPGHRGGHGPRGSA
jgi:hypothetical protein